MNTNSDLMNKAVSSADRITANTALYQEGGKTARNILCFEQPIEADEIFVSRYDWHEDGTQPVITFAREDGLTRGSQEQVSFSPETIPAFIDYLDEAFTEVVAIPTGPVTEEEVISELKTYPNEDLGDIFVATVRRGLRRDLLIAQEQGDKMTLNPMHVQYLAQGLKNAYQAYIEHPYS